ncbi:MAG TPA: outer membrane beta-barrel protein, partial [Allosphingosinicella sp.]
MKKYLLAAAAAFAFAAPAAAADFAGPRVGVTIGVIGDDIVDTDVTSFGLEAGYDWDLGGAVAGIQAEYQNDFDGDIGHELAATARVGGKIG